MPDPKSKPVVSGDVAHRDLDQPVRMQTGDAQIKKKRKKRKRSRSRTAQFTIGLLQIVAVGYGAILLALVMMETRLVYPAAYDDGAVPAVISSSAIETVRYESTEGVSLEGRLLVRQASPNILLFFHGNGEKAKSLDPWLERLSAAFNATVMVAEYRGFDDDHTPTEKGVIADCFAARDYLCERFATSPTEIILYGSSLGGGCAVAVASRGGAKALILEKTFDRMVSVAADMYPIIPINLLMRNRYDSIAKLTVYKGPLIVVHGTDDAVIPIERAKALYESSRSPQKHWIEVEGYGHFDPIPKQTLAEIVNKFNEFTSP